MPFRALDVVLAAMALLGPFAIHLFFPVIPVVKFDFELTDALAQLAFSLGVFGMAFSTLAYGTFADRYGRRPVLMVGLLLFLLGSTRAREPHQRTIPKSPHDLKHDGRDPRRRRGIYRGPGPFVFVLEGLRALCARARFGAGRACLCARNTAQRWRTPTMPGSVCWVCLGVRFEERIGVRSTRPFRYTVPA